MTQNIVIVEDDQPAAQALERALEQFPATLKVCHDGTSGLEAALAEDVDLVLTDLVLPEVDGMELLRRVLEARPGLTVIMMTAHGSVHLAVEAMKLGAWDFLEKPLVLDDVRRLVRNGLERARLQRENDALKSLVSRRFEVEGMIGKSQAMQNLVSTMQRAAQADVTVLIRGESGVGKELVAGALHRLSPRKDKPFVALNCAALSESLLDSELFGHVKGAFTGATAARQGRFEQADGGTLFLDEIGDVSSATQVKLLRVLQEGITERIGANEGKQVDVRLITATHTDLEAAMKAGTIREDFYWRIKGLEIQVPALRERHEDIPLLVAYFLKEFCDEMERSVPEVKADVLQAMQAYDWPGNIRQLRQVVQNLVVLGGERPLSLEDLPQEILDPPEASSHTGVSLKNVEREAIEEALAQTGGNKTAAARLLGIGLRTLYRRLQEYNIKA